MGTTTHGLRYPEVTDRVADGASAMRRLAEDVDATMARPAAPATPAGTDTRAVSVVEAAPTPQRYWQPGDADWSAAFGRLFAAGHTEAHIPEAATPYDVSSALALPAGMSLRADRGAVVRAVAAIVGPLLKAGAVGAAWANQHISGGVWDANANADNGIVLPYFLNATVSDLVIRDAKAHSLILGDPGAALSNEHKIRGVKVDRKTPEEGGAVPAGSYGVWTRNASDGTLDDVTVVGAETCFRNDGGDNVTHACHGWGYPGQLPQVIFDDNGYNNDYIACRADSPTVYCFRFRGFVWRLIGGSAFLNEHVADNTVVAIHCDQGYPTAAIVSPAVVGIAGHRFATDLEGPPLPNPYLDVISPLVQNVVDVKMGADYVRDLAASGWVQPGGGAGTATRVYSGSGSPHNVLVARVGDVYLRHDAAPFASTPQIYICNGDGAGGPGDDWYGGVSALQNGARIAEANNGARLFSGVGDPNTFLPGTSGDWYIRTDAAGTANARLYVCTGGTAWTGIV